MQKGVKVCANQERLIQAFYPQTYMIFDYYFVASDFIPARGLKNSYVGRCIPCGLVRVDRLFEYEKLQIPDAKYDRIKEKRKLVLALDYQVPESDYENITRTVAKVGQIRRFYGDLISLAREFPQLHIVIKGKFVETYSSSYIADLVGAIDRMENIEIETDFETYNPYFLSEKVDITIACHTSLADELMAAGRKVVLYEVSDYMGMNFDYEGLPPVVRNYEGLRRRVRDFLDGKFLDESKIGRLKEFYSNCYHGGVGMNVRGAIEQLLGQ